MALRRGFKAEAERLAVATRRDMGLDAVAKLDPWQLAKFLAIPVVSMGALAAAQDDHDLDEAVRVLKEDEQEAVSALTVIRGSKRMIVYNESHDPARSANDLAHEAGHGLLLHMPAPALDLQGCRVWNGDHEDEASYLGGALLVPKEAALLVARRQIPLADAAAMYGCSEQLMRWRVNITGAGLRNRPGPRQTASSPA